MYVLIEDNTDYYYSEKSHEVETFEELVDLWIRTSDVVAIYEVTRSISDDELNAERTKRARESMARRSAAMDAARAVLTPQQLKDLGLNG